MAAALPRGLLGAGLCLALAAAAAQACGVERGPVEVAADRNAVLIEDYVRTAGVAELGAVPAPSDPAARRDTRFLPQETMVWEVSATLLSLQRLADGDLRLVVAGHDHPQATLVAVVPAADCARDSRFRENIGAVRDALDGRFGGVSWVTPGLPVTLTGIAYFGIRRGEPGAAANGLELRPLIGIAFP